jgi:hypothetical protein
VTIRELIGGGMRKIAILAMLFGAAMAPDGAINKVCPIKGTPVKDGGPSSVYMGKTIGFC